MDLATLRSSLQSLSSGAAPANVGNALPLRVLQSGLSDLDEALALGGLPAGRVTEIAGPDSSGKTALAFELMAAQTRTGSWVAWVDGTGQFYPPAASAMGLDLDRCLLVHPKGKRRCTQGEDLSLALARAAEIIARSRAFPVVLVDLPKGVCVKSQGARRLRVAAQATGTAIVILSEKAGSIEGAAARIETNACQGEKERHRKTQFRIAKGGRGLGKHVELACRGHRFDDRPASATAPVLHRRLPGQEVQRSL